MAKAITISLQTLHSLYSKFLKKCILTYLPQNIQNEINILINFESPVDVYRHLTNLINNLCGNQEINKQDHYYQLLTRSQEKTNVHESSHKIKQSENSEKDKRQSKETSEKNSLNKKGLKILNSSLNYRDLILQNQQKNYSEHQKPVNRSQNLINLKSPTKNIHQSDHQIQKMSEILQKKSNNDSAHSLNMNSNFYYKLKRESDSLKKKNQVHIHSKQVAKQVKNQKKNDSTQKISKLLAPPLIPKNQPLNSIPIHRPYHIISPRIQTFGHQSENLNTYTVQSPTTNIKLTIKNLQQVFKQNQRKIQRYDKAYTSPPLSSVSSSGIGNLGTGSNILNPGNTNKY